jgi:hypothetical protein
LGVACATGAAPAHAAISGTRSYFGCVRLFRVREAGEGGTFRSRSLAFIATFGGLGLGALHGRGVSGGGGQAGEEG